MLCTAEIQASTKKNLSTASYLFADHKASRDSQSMSEIVNAIGQEV